ncbi:MAG: glycosyltransferase family 4 protein [Geminicoccaceae bacterium]
MDYPHDHTPALVQDDVRRLRVAIVHDWLTVYGGAERVLEHMLAVMPQADVYTLVDFVPDDQRGFLGGRTPRTSFIQRLPFARKHYRHYLPLMPLAIEQFDLSGYDLVISSSYAVAKGVITGPDQLHVSYVHSPVRFAWDLQHQYLRQSGMGRGLASWAVRALLHRIRLWDTRTANGVDHFLANSQFIARRVWKVYRRAAEVIYPPVDIGDFRLVEAKGGNYVTVSRLVPYKRVELLVEAFARLPDRHLTIIGAGPELERLRRVAPANVELAGFLPDAEVRRRLERARAFLFAAEEDFGIVMVEAQACGTPVIAYGKGGACEVVRDLGRPGATGVLFAEQTADSIVDAIARFEDAAGQIEPLACRRNAERFGHARFCSEFASALAEQWAQRGEARWRPVERDDLSSRRQRVLASLAR